MPEWHQTIPLCFCIGAGWNLDVNIYCIRDIQAARVDNKEHAAMLVTALGFTYQVIGAWPLWNQQYPWYWQQLIASYGNLLVIASFRQAAS